MHRRRRTAVVLSAAALLLLPLGAAGPAVAAPAPSDGGDGLDVYTGVVDARQLDRLFELGVDRREVDLERARGGLRQVRVEAILSEQQADDLAAEGLELEPKLVDGETVAARASALAEEPTGVFRPYSGEGGLQQEMEQQAAAHPDLAKLVVIGRTVQGKDIVAVKVGRDARTTVDGARPTAVYVGAQHAREWITPEMVRRLLDHVLDGYGTDASVRQLLDTTDLWFVPVANPDGYDFTFSDGQRLWRKNLRDNDGDGVITTGDGVDLNRNFPYKWGYDDEGSSPLPASQTYRGPAPASEPETQALIALHERLTPQFLVNYHSAAELLLHGVGWQVSTPTPDDVLYEAMVGDDEEPAVPGYDPDLSAELYTTNGDTDSYLQEAFGTLGFTPEMSTCEAVSASVPDDEWEADDCGSGFEFPDDEALVQAEFVKNIPFALAVARSAGDPDDPVSVVGRTAADFVVDSFEVSYGDPQTVAVVAKRALRGVTMRYRVNDGATRSSGVAEWGGGERYGDENDDYYAELRGTVRGTGPGDRVEVWFEGREPGEPASSSEHFSYVVEQDTDRRVLVLADEDYTGVNPDYPDAVTAPRYLETYTRALAALGVAADTWDVDADGVPHDLGVLSHYDTVLWYLGDNRLTQDPEDELTETYFGTGRDLAVAERAHYLTIAVRDFLNEGGKLVETGETTAYYGRFGDALGGIWYGLDGAPDQDCVITSDPRGDCLLLADDFTQYYLGAYSRTPLAQTTGVRGLPDSPFAGLTGTFGGPAVVSNPIDEVGAFTVTSDVLPVERFPQFASRAGAEYTDPAGPFIPVEGDWGAAALHEDDSFTRLARTFDLTGVPAAQTPRFEAQLSWDLEEGYDHVIVEARPVGSDDWTTLPDVGGRTRSDVPVECEVGFLLDLHPFLTSYLTPGDPCLPEGTSGQWHSFTGSSGGWQEVAFDLSAYAGQQVEVSVSHVTDPFTGGTGVILDDTRLRVGTTVRDVEGFEAGLGAWRLAAPPAGSPEGGGAFERSKGLGGLTAATLTDDTVLLGFGLEQLSSDAERVAFLRAALQHLRSGEREQVLSALDELDALVVTLGGEGRLSAFTTAGLRDRVERAREQAAAGRESVVIAYLQQLAARVANQVRDAGVREQLVPLSERLVRDLEAISTAEDLPPAASPTG